MVESAGLSLTEHQRKWLRRLRACEVSGKSFTEYATEHDFPVRELYDAKKTLVNKGVLPRTQQERIQRVQTVTESANFRNYAELIVMRGYTVLSSVFLCIAAGYRARSSFQQRINVASF